MLSLLNDGRYPAVDLEPQQRRQKTLEALVSQVAALSRAKPSADDLRGCTLGRPHEASNSFGRIIDRMTEPPCAA